MLAFVSCLPPRHRLIYSAVCHCYYLCCLPYSLVPTLHGYRLPSIMAGSSQASATARSAITTVSSYAATVMETRIPFRSKFPSGPIDISVSVAVLYNLVYVQTERSRICNFFAWYCMAEVSLREEARVPKVPQEAPLVSSGQSICGGRSRTFTFRL